MNEFEILAAVVCGIVGLMALMILCLRWGAEQERQARIEALNKKSPLGVISGLPPKIEGNIFLDLPPQIPNFMSSNVSRPSREKPRMRPHGRLFVCEGGGKMGFGKTMEGAWACWSRDELSRYGFLHVWRKSR